MVCQGVFETFFIFLKKFFCCFRSRFCLAIIAHSLGVVNTFFRTFPIFSVFSLQILFKELGERPPAEALEGRSLLHLLFFLKHSLDVCPIVILQAVAEAAGNLERFLSCLGHLFVQEL